ncbi:acyl carrier protein ['Crotalaria aegyptiaca' phytoplasma]|uniref:Acyl carrier protein n=1 Tax=Candidatus Phytoplasma crotalariae TaxID=2982627 RepID=A0ABT9D2I2_9MOLU|nr:acyl carrier protein ['Crotalaria aegyptiaca' phytoplasma]MDO8059226.1 acyl carrier protein ['Crotalaria aegyptiaca' phytoplasma]
MFNKIQKIISEQLSLSEDLIQLDTKLKEDLGMDSIDAVNLAIQLEKNFNIKISDEQLQQFKLVQDIVVYIEAHDSGNTE